MSAAHDLFDDDDAVIGSPAALTPAEAEDAAKGPPTREDRIAEVNELIARAEIYTKSARSHPDPHLQTVLFDEADRILAQVDKLQNAIDEFPV